MGYVLILVGVILTVAGVRDKQSELFTQVESDFSGQNSFVWWLVSIGGIGAVGYVPQLQSLSRVFLALVLVVLLLRNKTVFDQLSQALKGTPDLRGTSP